MSDLFRVVYLNLELFCLPQKTLKKAVSLNWNASHKKCKPLNSKWKKADMNVPSIKIILIYVAMLKYRIQWSLKKRRATRKKNLIRNILLYYHMNHHYLRYECKIRSAFRFRLQWSKRSEHQQLSLTRAEKKALELLWAKCLFFSDNILPLAKEMLVVVILKCASFDRQLTCYSRLFFCSVRIVIRLKGA